MVFVTSGTQLPFDRLVLCIDEIAPRFPQETFVVQSICKHQVKSSNVVLRPRMKPDEFRQVMDEASLVISHAGVGSIISAAQTGKMLIVFPRFGKLKEHRNDHQVATCEAMKKEFPLNVATNSNELRQLVEKFYAGELSLLPRVTPFASDDLIGSIKEFINPEPVLSLS